MDLVAIENSRLTRLMQATRLAGQLYIPSAISALVERYRFAKFPTDISTVSDGRAEFEHGIFQGAAIDFNLYNDGVVIASRSNTDILDEFFADLMEWAQDAFGITPIETQNVNTIYESTVIVSSEKDILRPLKSFSKIAKLVSERLSDTSHLNVAFEPFGVTCAPDAAKITGIKPPPFRLERWAGVEFSFRNFFSSAPLRTQDHLRILSALEESL